MPKRDKKVKTYLTYGEDVSRNNTLVLGGTKYKLLEPLKDSFISYIPGCEDEQDGVDECGEYYDENCRVFCDEVWWVINKSTNLKEQLKINSFYGFWYKIIENEKKYKMVSLDEDDHKNWAKVIK